jgi:hypothetical protein
MGRRLPLCLSAAIALAGAPVALAVAPGALADPPHRPNTIKITAPPQVTKGNVYDVTITGYSRRKATAYLFVDYQKCAPTLAAENLRDGQESDVYKVKGRFAETSGWKSAAGATDHACAYLISASSNASLASAKQAFQVH